MKMNLLSSKQFHSWHAKTSSRNAWIFHGGLDTCHRKRSHFTVSCPWGNTLQIIQLQGEGATSLHYREPQPLCVYMDCPIPNSQQAVQSTLGTEATNKLSYSTEKHQIHDDVQNWSLWAKIVETVQKSRREKKLMGKKMAAPPKYQWKVTGFSRGLEVESWRTATSKLFNCCIHLRKCLFLKITIRTHQFLLTIHSLLPGNLDAAITWLRSHSNSAEIQHSSVFGCSHSTKSGWDLVTSDSFPLLQDWH